MAAGSFSTPIPTMPACARAGGHAAPRANDAGFGPARAIHELFTAGGGGLDPVGSAAKTAWAHIVFSPFPGHPVGEFCGECPGADPTS
jgi:hypothetical protein